MDVFWGVLWRLILVMLLGLLILCVVGSGLSLITL